MEIKQFVQNFYGQFEDIDPKVFSPKTRFRDVDGWSSLVALSIIAMVDEEYNIKLKGDDIRKAITIEDIYNIIKSK